MSGGVVQLVATGSQDEWLTGKPEVSFYRSNYKRHTHYSSSVERQIIQGTPVAGGISTIRFEKKGDLLSYVYFIGKDSTGSLVPGIDWSKVIDKLELLVGGQVIDTQDIVWMTQVEPVPGAQNYSTRYLNTNPTGLTNVLNGFLPLKFFFCKDWSVSVPLVGLQFHDVEIRITWSNNLNYRVSYELYSVAASSTATVPSFTPSGVATTATAATPFTSSAAAAQTVNITATLGGALTAATGFSGGSYTAATLPTVTAAGGVAAGTLTASFGTLALTLGGTPGTGNFSKVYGSGWTGPPTLTLGGSGAATATMGIAAFTYNSGSPATGFPVSQSALSVTFTGPSLATGGAYATGTAVTDSSGNITSVTLSTPGSGYTTTSGLTLTAGAVTSGTFSSASLGIISTAVTTQGSGVTSVSGLTIPATPGSGSGATLTPVLTVVSISASGGTGYLNGAALSFSGGTTSNPASGGVVTVTTASRSQPAGTFTYSGANFQMVPGAVFTPSNLAASIYVVSVSPTSSTSGTFTGYLSTTGSVGVLTVSGTQTLAGYRSAGGNISITNSIDFTTGGPSYTSQAITYSSGTPPLVNTVLSSFGNSASPGTNATAYISAVSITSDTGASVTITVIGSNTGSAAPTGAPFTATATAGYPILNMVIAAPTSGTITSGMSVLGFAAVANQNAFLPTVANVYSSTLVSVATNQFQVASAGAAPVLKAIGTMDTQYQNTSLWFVPTNYYAGSVSAAPTTATTGGTATSLSVQYTTVNGAAATSWPTLGATVFFINPGATITNCYVQTGTSSASFGISYTAATGGTTAIAQYSQFFVVPQVAARAQLATSQPETTNSGVATLSLTALTGTTPIAVGQQVIGTAYTGPVSVVQVISQGAFSSSSSTVTAAIEVSFPVQTVAPSTATGTGTLLQFIDPTTTLGTGVTAATTGFNGTYQQLQYEAWCNFIYLDQTERDYFAKTPQDMLITQVQRISIQSASYQEIAIAQPVKYIAFLSNNYATAYQQSQTASYPAPTSYYLKTQINGVDVGDSRSMLQWQDVTQYYHTPYGYNNMGYVAPVAIIPYCLDTSKLQPTGTLNFSRLDNYRVVAPTGSNLLLLSGGASYFYAVNYNILRIQNGLGGLLYAN